MENKLYLIEPEADDVSAIYKGNSCFAVYGASLYFRIGDEDDEEEGSWRDDTVTHPVQIAIEYFDKGTEDIVVGYTRTGSSETTETVVTKGNTLKWKTVFYTLAHEAMIGSAYYIDNGLADLRLYSDGVLYISLLNITETTLQVDAQETANGKGREFSKTIASDNFVSGSAGWRITREGNAEFNSVTVRGTIYATLGQIGGFDIGSGTITADSGAFTLNSTTPSILMGAATNYSTGAGIFMGKSGSYYNFRVGDPAGSYMTFNGTTGVLSIVGASVTIGAGTSVGGWTIAVTPDRLINDTGVDATSAGMSPSDYPFYAGAEYANRTSAPFRVNPAGEIWATKATISGAMVFQKSMVSAFAGSQIIATSASVLTADATGGASFSISVKGQGGAAPFTSGDHIRLTNTAGTSTWGTVGSPSGSDPYTYTVTRTVGSGTPAYVTGNTVVDYGTTGSGYIVLAAEGSNTPQISINTWATNPSSGTITEQVRIGKLSGITDPLLTPSGYGIYTSNGYFTGTIVGSTIKTATSNQRVELTTSYLQGYNAGGTSVFGFALGTTSIGGASRDVGDFVVGSGGELFYDASAGVLNLKGLAVQMLTVAGTGNIQLDPQGYAFIRLSSNGKKTITGIKPTANANGQLLVIKHDGTGKLILKRNTTSGDYMPINTQSSKDITIDGYGNALLQYDSVNNGWTVIAFRSKNVNNGGATASAQTAEGSYDEVVNIIAPLSEGAINGSLIIGRAGATLVEDMAVPGSGTWTATFATPSDGAYSFANSDVVYVKSGASVTWFTVVQSSIDDDTQVYTATYASGTRPETYEGGLDVTSYGQSGQGFLLLTASDSAAPFISVRGHAGSPWTTQTEYVRMGNLDGGWGYSGATYGFAVGEYGSNKPNITIDPTNGLRIRHNTTNVITLDTSGNASIAGAMTIGASLSIGTSGNIKSGATAYNTGTGFFLEYNAGTPRFFIGAAAGHKLTWDGTSLAITGNLTATTGTIGGWTINSTTIDGTDATLDSTGILTLGTSNNVIILSAVDATYRLWIGHATAGSAPFRVSKAGAVNATSGLIGGFTLGSTTLTATNLLLDAGNQKIVLGSGTDVAALDAADSTYRLAIGHSTYASAPFRVTKAGAITASNIDLAGGSVSGTFTVSGTLRSAASPNARYELTSVGLKTYDSGNTQRTQILNDGSGWLGSSSVFAWTAAGVVSLNGSAVVGNSLDADKVTFSAPTISGLTLTNNSPGAGSVAWSSFKLTYQGTTYTISSGNTASKYIYWKKATSTTVLQTGASIPSNAVDMFMVAVNLSGTAYQSNFAPFIYGDYIAAGTITASHVTVSSLSALSADLGTITAGTITAATVRTASSGARIEMNSTSIFGTNGTTTQWEALASTGKFTAGAGKVGLDAGGISVVANTSAAIGSVNGYKFVNSLGGTEIGGYYSSLSASSVYTYIQNDATVIGSRHSSFQINSKAPAGYDSTLTLNASGDNGTVLATLAINAVYGGIPNFTFTGGILPQTDATYDLSSSSSAWRDLYLSRILYVGSVNSNANMTKGITLKNSSNDEILSLKRNSISHGMTGLTEGDTYGTFSAFQNANGSLGIKGYSASTVGVRIDSFHTTDNTVKSATGVGSTVINAEKKSGSGSAAPGANANLLVVRSADTTRFIVDLEGDIHMDATSNINAWDDHDDVALLEAYRVKTAKPNFKHMFAQDIEKSAKILSDTGVLTLNDDGHHFVSMKGLMGLTIDAIRQMNMKLQVYERALTKLGVNVKELEA